MEGSMNDYRKQRLRAIVVDNNDPQKAQRLKVRIPHVLEADNPSNLPWAAPAGRMIQGGTNTAGIVDVPPIGAKVYVRYEGSDQDAANLMWEGVCYDTTTKIPEAEVNYPARKVVKDLAGNVFYSDTKTGDVHLQHKSGTTVHITPGGDINITTVGSVTHNVSGNYTLSVSGNIKMSGARIDLN